MAVGALIMAVVDVILLLLLIRNGAKVSRLTSSIFLLP
jgi:hypothetical protein